MKHQKGDEYPKQTQMLQARATRLLARRLVQHRHIGAACQPCAALQSNLPHRRSFGCFAQRVESEAGFHDIANETLESIQDAVDALDDHLDDVDVEYSVCVCV